MQNSVTKLSSGQIENLLDTIIPLVASDGDEMVFRFAISKVLEKSSPAESADFIGKLLKKAATQPLPLSKKTSTAIQ
jgi:hypothetical protein